MHNRNKFVVWFQNGILFWMPTVTLVRASLDGSEESVDGKSVMQPLGMGPSVGVIPHFPQDLPQVVG